MLLVNAELIISICEFGVSMKMAFLWELVKEKKGKSEMSLIENRELSFENFSNF